MYSCSIKCFAIEIEKVSKTRVDRVGRPTAHTVWPTHLKIPTNCQRLSIPREKSTTARNHLGTPYKPACTCSGTGSRLFVLQEHAPFFSHPVRPAFLTERFSILGHAPRSRLSFKPANNRRWNGSRRGKLDAEIAPWIPVIRRRFAGRGNQSVTLAIRVTESRHARCTQTAHASRRQLFSRGEKSRENSQLKRFVCEARSEAMSAYASRDRYNRFTFAS